MSSILRALKKLESGPAQADAFKALSGDLDVNKAVRRKSRRPRPGRIVIWFVSAAVFASIVFWLFGTYERLPGKNVSPKHPVNRVAVKPVDPPPADPPPAARPAPKKNPPRALPKRAAGPPAVEKQTPMPARPAPAVRVRPQPPVKTKTPGPPRPAPPAPATARDAATVIESGEAGFVVQAIAWSETPAKRIAVINGKVVHEKDSVGGATVSEIGLDDVFLKTGDQTLRLRFRR